MPGMNGTGSAGGGGRGMGGGGRGMGGGGRGMGGGGRGMGGGGRGMGGTGQNNDTTSQKTSEIGEDNLNLIAISSEGPTLDDRVDPRNGQSQAMSQGAGIQAAETVANTGAKAVLTGFVGPKAFDALSAAGVKIGQDLNGMTVRQALEKFKNGEVSMADNPNRQAGGHK